MLARCRCGAVDYGQVWLSIVRCASYVYSSCSIRAGDSSSGCVEGVQTCMLGIYIPNLIIPHSSPYFVARRQ
jgi:hypothetical protein